MTNNTPDFESIARDDSALLNSLLSLTSSMLNTSAR